jgi:hypothetical protein
MRDRLVTGLFRDRESAEKTYGHLGPRSYRAEDVDVMMPMRRAASTTKTQPPRPSWAPRTSKAWAWGPE